MFNRNLTILIIRSTIGNLFAALAIYPGRALCDGSGFAGKAVVADPAVAVMQSVAAEADPVDTKFRIGCLLGFLAMCCMI